MLLRPSNLLLKLVICVNFAMHGFAADELPITPPPDAYGLELIEDGPLLHDDNTAYYGLLAHASLVKQDELRVAGRDFLKSRLGKTKLPTFLDMIRNPAEFRGKPVFLQGHVLQTLEYNAAPNEYGIEKLYEVSLFIEDAQAHPMTVVFLEKPEQLKIGGEMVDGIQVSGYFLKAYHYPSTDKHTRVAPLILANTITIKTAPRVAPLVPAVVSYGGLLLVFAVLIAIVWYVTQSDRRRMLKRQHLKPEDAPDFKKINVSDSRFE